MMVTVDDAYVDVRGSAVMYFSFGKDNQSSFWLEHHMYVCKNTSAPILALTKEFSIASFYISVDARATASP